MPLRLTVGLSQKVGQPNYGSLGASCQVEFELEESSLQADPEAFQSHVRESYAACAQAIAEELDRQTATARPRRLGHDPAQNSPSDAEIARAGSPAPYHERWATPPQARAIKALTDKLSVPLEDVLARVFQVSTIERLTSGQASQLILRLQSLADRAVPAVPF